MPSNGRPLEEEEEEEEEEQQQLLLFSHNNVHFLIICVWQICVFLNMFVAVLSQHSEQGKNQHGQWELLLSLTLLKI
jgi:hypothetical protein